MRDYLFTCARDRANLSTASSMWGGWRLVVIGMGNPGVFWWRWPRVLLRVLSWSHARTTQWNRARTMMIGSIYETRLSTESHVTHHVIWLEKWVEAHYSIGEIPYWMVNKVVGN